MIEPTDYPTEGIVTACKGICFKRRDLPCSVTVVSHGKHNWRQDYYLWGRYGDDGWRHCNGIEEVGE